MSSEELNTTSTINFILEGGLKLRCISSTIAKAMLFAHQFIRCADKVSYDPAMLAAAALSLSSRSFDETLNETEVVLTFYHMVKGEYLMDLYSETKIDLEKSLKITELFLFRMLEGLTSHNIAHEYVAFYSRNLLPLSKIVLVWESYMECVWKIISDFYTSKKCLDYQASHIAIAAIQAALTNIDVQPTISDEWHKLFCPDLTAKMKDQIVEDILEICNLA
ncbi:cyclin-Q-like [Stegodyphus dumicola]|uniref:cyclin-Q-like n=1 Tax=Stegodyphus dumicola TaxID=202533 RepID=UPI0015B2BD33|nr:cyclin-Q-like [Stegodyphus dumicola]XP_035220386.1 cyclin-Q-like [Stegodyphus dumicola]